MLRARQLILIVAVCWTSALRAVEIRPIVAPGLDAPGAAVFHAQRVDGDATPLEQAINLSGPRAVPLPPGLWEMRITGSGVWAEPFYGRNTDSIAVKFWRTASISGTSTSIPALRVRFQSIADGPAGEVDCTSERTLWNCVVPAGRFDLVFRVTGLSPEFRFGVDVPPDDGKIDLRFEAGASISGRVEVARGEKSPVEGIDVSLASPGAGNRQPLSTRTDARGFFQFKSLPPGDYSLRASKGAALFSQTQTVKVLRGLAAELTNPLLLDRPKRLAVSVIPMLDPHGQPWRIRLSSTNHRLRQNDLIAESATSPLGEWTHSRVLPGEYTVAVLTSKGEQWRDEEFVVAQNDVVKSIGCLPERIIGTVKLGDRPLKATLTVDGEWGVKLVSDSTGRFAGAIPPREDSERLVLIEAEEPSVKRTVRMKVSRTESGEMETRIELRATVLKGVVVDSDHAPQPHAIVTVSGNNPDTFEQAFAGDDGRFNMSGFEPGRYRVVAEVFEHRSEPVSIDLKEDATTEIELAVEPIVRVTGQITTISHAPIIASEIHAIPRDRWTSTVPVSRSNEGGFFELELPPGTTTFDGVALHPAFDIVIGRAKVQKEKQLNLSATQLGGTLTIETTVIDDAMLLHNGAEIQAAWLATEAGGSVTARAVTIPRLQPGHYSACSRATRKCASGDIAPFGKLTLTVPD